MGKKEKDINKQNKKYLADEEKRLGNKVARYSENPVEEEKRKRDKLERDKFDFTRSNILEKLVDYTSHRGLALCETIDNVNLENYITHLIKPRPLVSFSEVDKYDDESIVSKEKPSVTVEELDLLAIDCERVKAEMIFSLGKDKLTNDWKEFDRELFGRDLHVELIKKFGTDRYNDMVNNLGTHVYKQIILKEKEKYKDKDKYKCKDKLGKKGKDKVSKGAKISFRKRK